MSGAPGTSATEAAAAPTALGLEPSSGELRRLLAAAGERVLAHLDGLAQAPSWDLDGAEQLAAALREVELPEQGRPFEELLELLFERAIPKSYNAAGPGYLAFIPGGGLFAAALADLIADSANRFTGLWAPAPALVQLETNVLRWFCRLVGLPPCSGGVLTTGGSMANLIALVTARRTRLGDDFGRAVLYASDQAHHSLAKAALLAGFSERQLRSLPSDERFRLRVDLLRERLTADRAAGLEPFLVVANGGSTNTGAVDDLAALSELARHERLWLHVDAAYGGFFALTERGRRALDGLAQADSITLDPHKSLFLPYGNGALLVRQAAALRQAHAAAADYLPPAQDGLERLDFASLSPELSRDFRGLRVWLPLKLHGAAAFRAALDEKLDLAQRAVAGLRELPGLEILAEPQLSVVAFRLRPRGPDTAVEDARNRALLARINARRRVFLSGTVLRGAFALRLCVLSFRTHAPHVEMALADVRAALAEE